MPFRGNGEAKLLSARAGPKEAAAVARRGGSEPKGIGNRSSHSRLASSRMRRTVLEEHAPRARGPPRT